jgi:hypothetical protein
MLGDVQRLLLVAAVIACATSAAAQSLGEAAAREEARRRRSPNPSPAPVLTNDDLARAQGDGLSTTGRVSPPAASPSPGASSSPASATSPAPERGEAYWRQRFADARRRIAEAEARAWVEVIEPVLVGSGGMGGMTGGRAVYAPMKVRKFVETEELRQARRALDDLHEELRKAGGLPGWGRE